MPSLEVNGTTLHYEDTAPGSTGETVAFCHGLLWSTELFAPQIAALRDRYRCLAWDHRGQGQSAADPLRQTIGMELVWQDAVALLEARADGPVHFVGLSMGGFVAMRMAARRPDLVRSLILLETSADPEPTDNVPRYRLLTRILKTFGSWPLRRQVGAIMLGRSTLTDRARRAEVAQFIRVMSRRPDVWRAVNGVIDRAGVYDELRRITAPTLVLVGDEDVATPRPRAERIVEAIGGAQLVEIPRAGHSSPVEQPAAVTAAIEAFLAGLGPDDADAADDRDGGSLDYDYVIVGSGFGGAVSACRLAEKGYSVAVIEMGKRWTAADFPKTTWNLRRFVWRPGLKLFGFFNMRPFRHVMILCGNAVGGGSITYANTMLVPPDEVWREGSWRGLAPWEQEMPAHYATAQRMLGVTQNRILADADHMLKRIADDQGVGDTFYKTDVAVYFGEPGDAPGTPHPDPYFDGAGPPRSSCTGCGGCMVGCRFNAKNTLDKNYLHLAERHGAKILAETRVVDVRPRGAADGADGYELTTERSTAWWFKRRQTVTARHVVFSASSLGTMDLLMRCKQRGSLPGLSDRLGAEVRTNSESIVGVRFPGKQHDMSKGIAIGSGIHLDRFTHIEATRYSRGSDALGLIATLLVSGSGWRRVFAWLGSAFRHPIRFARASWPFGFARQTLILLVMQTIDATLRFELRRRWWWPFQRLLCSSGTRIPTNIPAANALVERAAQTFGGVPITSTTEILFDLPMTAHCIGGCVMGADASEGVIDANHRVFGYDGLYVVDGAAVGANLGVNPSLTITALAERAMANIPPRDRSS